MDLADDRAVGENPKRARDSIIIGSGVKINVFKRLRSNTSGLRVVHWVKRLKVCVIAAVDGEFDRHIGGKVEIRVECACAMSVHDAFGCRELVDIVVASPVSVNACFDAVAFILDLREGEVDFGGDTGNIEASDI